MTGRALMVLAFLGCVGGLSGTVWSFGKAAALDQVARRGQADLELAADRLKSELQRYRELAVLMADHPTLLPLVGAAPRHGGPPASADVAGAMALLLRTADQTGALDVILIDAAGREVMAASTAAALTAPAADLPDAVGDVDPPDRATPGRAVSAGQTTQDVTPGRAGSAGAMAQDVTRGGVDVPPSARTAPVSHAAESYFLRAMDGALGVAHDYSERYARRAFVFGAPVFGPDGPVVGAVVVVTDVEEIEAGWRGDRAAVFFTDELGVIFASNRSELVLRSRAPAPGGAADVSYTAGPLAPFIDYELRSRQPHEIWRVDAGRYIPERAMHLTLPVPVIDMTGEALLDIAPALRLVALLAAATAAICLSFGALLFLAAERRRSLASENVRLEARVAQRTAQLSALNADLRREVTERAAAEARLKRAQADLVQAGKLSALGQMSAGISHELNQPLMAIRSFAENAEAFLARDKPAMAAQNLGRISDLARRMGRIIRNLRAFARQENEPLTNVDLSAVVEAALEMVAGRARQTEVALEWTPPPQPMVVRGGEVRLQQVILNLVSNAIDAMEESAEKRVEIVARANDARVTLSVRDTGPGIAQPEKIFDPFYTTKRVAEGSGDRPEGMGLGLSISYGLVQSFGGMIRGRNLPEGGAEFTVELDAAQAAQAA